MSTSLTTGSRPGTSLSQFSCHAGHNAPAQLNKEESYAVGLNTSTESVELAS